MTDGVLNRQRQVDLQAYRPKIQELQRARASVVAAAEQKAGQAILDKAAAEKGATKTASGLVIVPIKPGTGAVAEGDRPGQGPLPRHARRRHRVRQLRPAGRARDLPAERRGPLLDGGAPADEGRREEPARLPGRPRLRRSRRAAPDQARRHADLRGRAPRDRQVAGSHHPAQACCDPRPGVARAMFVAPTLPPGSLRSRHSRRAPTTRRRQERREVGRGNQGARGPAGREGPGRRRRRRPTPMSAPLTVGSVTAAPGQLASGWIDVPDGVDSGTRVPVTVANGAAAGPVARAGRRHARLGVHVDPGSPAPAAPTRAGPDAGRRDPGPHGEPAGVLRPAHLLRPRREEPEPRLPRPGRRHGERADRPRDHARGDRSVHPPRRHALRRRQRVAPALQLLDRRRRRRTVDAESRELALAYGLDHILVDRGRPRDPAASVYTANTAITRGKPAITAESGGLGAHGRALGRRPRGRRALASRAPRHPGRPVGARRASPSGSTAPRSSALP